MIYILQGDDVVSSSKYLEGITEGITTTFLDGMTLTIKTLEDNILSTDLFSAKKAVVVENLLSKNPKKNDLINFINSKTFTCDLILFEDKKILKTTTSKIKNSKIMDFILPSYYFKFLDSISPRQKKESFALYHQLLSSYAPELVFYSMLKRIRQLVILSRGENNDDLAKMNSWQLSNLKRQLSFWHKDNLSNFYNQLKDTEINLKTGSLPLSLSKHLDILLLSQLT